MELKLIFAFILVYLIGIYILIWLPLFRNLQVQKKATFQMISLIPVNIIYNNKNIMEGLKECGIIKDTTKK